MIDPGVVPRFLASVPSFFPLILFLFFLRGDIVMLFSTSAIFVKTSRAYTNKLFPLLEQYSSFIDDLDVILTIQTDVSEMLLYISALAVE